MLAFQERSILKKTWLITIGSLNTLRKEEKYRFYKENVISEGDIWIEYDKKEVICIECGKKLKI